MGTHRSRPRPQGPDQEHPVAGERSVLVRCRTQPAGASAHGHAAVRHATRPGRGPRRRRRAARLPRRDRGHRRRASSTTSTRSTCTTSGSRSGVRVRCSSCWATSCPPVWPIGWRRSSGGWATSPRRPAISMSTCSSIDELRGDGDPPRRPRRRSVRMSGAADRGGAASWPAAPHRHASPTCSTWRAGSGRGHRRHPSRPRRRPRRWRSSGCTRIFRKCQKRAARSRPTPPPSGARAAQDVQGDALPDGGLQTALRSQAAYKNVIGDFKELQDRARRVPGRRGPGRRTA